MGALLYRLGRIEKQPEALTEKELTEIADFCNACASLSTTRRGSMSVMSSPEEISGLRVSGVLGTALDIRRI